ncbi:MAG: pyruvate kinase [Planctomycetota bacterium]|nr:pyruvate kinase [Planctomycetota bacterium]MDA1112902.1 pyruvate kinase [Planctomycetota bacterium]
MPINPRRTKVLATLGPACCTLAKIREMVRAGVNGFRLNMSHGDAETRAKWVRRVKKVRKELDRPIAILVDLRGPRIRLGNLHEPRDLTRGENIVIHASKVDRKDGSLPVDYRNLNRDLSVGDRILIRDGRVELKVIALNGKAIECKVRRGGHILANSGVNLPDSEVSAPALSRKDRVDIAFAVEHKVDWLALSFVRRAADVESVHKELKKYGLKIPVMSKIEHPQAIEELEGIFEVSDGVMVARGDLAVEMGHAIVPSLQKRIVRMAIERACPVVVATQMLESMIEVDQPTRAEVSDVANAVLDGADCVMLSGETAVGAYPLEACRIMRLIARKTESVQFTDTWRLRPSIRPTGGLKSTSVEMATVNAAVYASQQAKAGLILTFTESGRSVRLVSSFRAKAPIVALSANERSFHRMSLYWGVSPGRLSKVRRLSEMNRYAAAYLKDNHALRPDQYLVSLTGTFAVSGVTNTVRIIRFDQLG